MKKLIYFVLFILLFGLVGCGEEIVDPPKEKRIIISYYDGDRMVQAKEYYEEITLYEYTKKNYTFKGWYLDSSLTNPIDLTNLDRYFNETSLDLYARMEKEMKDLSISITGVIEDKVVVNPIFNWINANNDSSFKVSITSNGEEVETTTITTTTYQVSKLLNKNSNYIITIEGLSSGCRNQLEFSTMSDYIEIASSITIQNPFSDGMVIQRDRETLITGKGPSYQLLTLTIEDEVYTTITNETGYFEFTINEREASFDPVSITISNGVKAKKTVNDILFGDVYLFAGQSNMQWTTASSDYKPEDIENLVNSNVRFFAQDVTTATTKQSSVKNGRWFKPTSFNCLNFSAIATMTASILGTDLKTDVPIGIITAYQGDTNIANWMGPEYYSGSVSTKYLHYNAMVYPLKGTNLTGVVWYQGCNNSASGCDYKELLHQLFANYRDIFNNDRLAFFVIGLACYDGDNGNNFDFSYVRESQALACEEDDRAFFISICDDGDPTYIHPKAKRYICIRVAKSIESVVYHKEYYAEGPSYKSHEVIGNTVYIELNNSSGLHSGGQINGLLLAGSDGKYYEASATIIDNRIVASSDKVSNPVYIKYGFGKSPFVNIFNRDGFAITPFRTDNYNTNIDLLDYNSIANYYFHPDGSEMSVSLSEGNLVISKANDGKGYGSVRLDKWGAIAYHPEGFRITIKGSNSGAQITFRAIEGDSYEIWGYKILDDFEGYKTFNIDVGEFIVVYGKQNNIFEPQKIGYIEIMVETNNALTFEISEARFVSIERSKPTSFMVSNVSESDDELVITVSEALFANSYELFIKASDETIITSKEQEQTTFRVNKSLFNKGLPYYIYVNAKNELGSTASSNDGYVFYLKDEDQVIVCNFDFKDQASLQAYLDSSMSVHAGLNCELDSNGVKINSSGQGWQQFIFKLEPGIANGMTKLTFTANFTNYKGQVILQLADTNYKTYSYTLDTSSQSNGQFTIEFSSFNTPFTTQTLMWVMFNFNDGTGNGYIILDDVILTK